TSMASLHLDPLSISSPSQQAVTLTETDDAKNTQTRLRRALYGVVGATMLALGMGIALIVIEPGQREQPTPTPASPGSTAHEASTSMEATSAPEELDDGAEHGANHADAEEAEEPEIALSATATASAATPPTPSPRVPAPAPKTKTPPPPGKAGLPLPPERPDF
ncbi:MAG: hypothetical protein RIF41_09930, partial [Polyangiaceae bacterium]